jgi:hypothetical protein
MRSLLKITRTILIASALMCSAIIAHLGGCGSFVSKDRLVLETVALVALYALFSVGKLEGPRLAILIVFSQLSVHFILGGMLMNNLRMLLFHFLGGVLGYWIVIYLERFFYDSHRISELRLLLTFTAIRILRFNVSKAPAFGESLFFSRRSRRLEGLRAPPALGMN